MRIFRHSIQNQCAFIYLHSVQHRSINLYYILYRYKNNFLQISSSWVLHKKQTHNHNNPNRLLCMLCGFIIMYYISERQTEFSLDSFTPY